MISRLRFLQVVGFACVLPLILSAASAPPASPEWTRLQGMPQAERQRLWANLQRFDKMKRADQETARELDRHIASIGNPSEKAHYLGVLKRYHLWFESLPQASRDELLNASPDKRMAIVSKIMSDQKVHLRAAAPLLLLQIADLSSFSPVEVAVIFKVWQKLSPATRSELETIPLAQFRNRIALRGAKADVTEAGLLPTNYNEEEWRKKVDKRPQRLFPAEQIPKKRELTDELKRHLALNLYFLEHPPKSVSEANLALFLSQLPAVVRSSFDIFPPDEARRRLSISYRLAFRDEEIPAPRNAGGTPPAGVKGQPGAPAAPAQPKPAAPPAASSPVVPL